MGRTAIEIDDELVERVMRRYRLPGKSAAVDLALRRLAGEPMSRDEDFDAIARHAPLPVAG
jgi:Arc/MetJ family transcription regulator